MFVGTFPEIDYEGSDPVNDDIHSWTQSLPGLPGDGNANGGAWQKAAGC